MPLADGGKEFWIEDIEVGGYYDSPRRKKVHVLIDPPEGNVYGFRRDIGTFTEPEAMRLMRALQQYFITKSEG